MVFSTTSFNLSFSVLENLFKTRKVETSTEKEKTLEIKTPDDFRNKMRASIEAGVFDREDYHSEDGE